MEFHTIFGTDLVASRIGFGCWAIGGHGYGPADDDISIAAIHAALDVGVNLFDTADVYGFGRSECVLRKALGTEISNVVVATKFGIAWDDTGRTRRDSSPNHIVASLEGSLKRLGLEAIPLYQLHWHDGLTPLHEIAGVLEDCRRAGKIKHAGFCNMPVEQWGESRAVFASSQLSYGLNDRELAPELARLAEIRMSTLAYNVLSRGLLSGKYETDASRKFGEYDSRGVDLRFSKQTPGQSELVQRLRVVAARNSRTPAQVAIRWSLDSTGVSSALVGIRDPAQAIENAASCGWRLSRDDWEWLAS